MAVIDQTQTQPKDISNCRLRVYRYKRGDGEEHFDEFDVPVDEHATLLDALRWIQLHCDRSLSVRYSCMHASCGTCGVRVDGSEELACVCSLAAHGHEVTVEPLANLPVLTDLVIDMRPFYGRFPVVHPIIRISELPQEAEPPEDHGPFVRLEDCIECGLCLSACPVAATELDYLGPAALSAAQRLLEEPRGADREHVLAWASSPDGAWRCHLGFCCTDVCPTDQHPSERLMALRHELAFGALHAELDRAVIHHHEKEPTR
ncbi:MAG: succinate dehydrogenase/fumarate reductase iron-sulfur subunit [Solirubrobacteraceae bacterium]|jgi:succinate dehydrogenase / fumarate reductase iron-sulfur subunit